MSLAAPPMPVVHALPVGKHETLVSIGGGIEVGNSKKFQGGFNRMRSDGCVYVFGGDGREKENL